MSAMDDQATPPHTVVIVDDHADVREMLRLRIDATDDLTVVGTAGSAREGVDLAREAQPDVVLLDLGLPDLDGVEALPLLRAAAPGARIIVLSGYPVDQYGDAAARAGADGFVEKRPRAPFVETIRTTLAQPSQPPRPALRHWPLGTREAGRHTGERGEESMMRTDAASRVIAAPPDVVFAALVDPAALAGWLPPAGMSARFERFDARPGGSFRMVLTYADASAAPGKSSPDTDIVEARFVEITPGDRVVLAVGFDSDDPAFAGTMTMTWQVTAVPGGTRVDFRADDVPPGVSAEDHVAGMTSSLAQLAAQVEV